MLKQVAVFVENKPGSLKQVTSVLQETGISIYAFSSFDSPEFGILRLVVDEAEKAKDVLTSRGFVTRVGDVIAVQIADLPGAMDEVLGCLKDNKINVNYCYSSFAFPDGESPVIIHTDELERAEEALKKSGFVVDAKIR